MDQVGWSNHGFPGRSTREPEEVLCLLHGFPGIFSSRGQKFLGIGWGHLSELSVAADGLEQIFDVVRHTRHQKSQTGQFLLLHRMVKHPVAVGEVERLRQEVARMEVQGEELEGLIRGVTSGERSPREMIDRIDILEEENRDLRARLNQGREGVERLLARIRFLEEQK